MSEDNRKALPEPDNIEVPNTYKFSGAPWMKIPEGQGEHLVKLAETVEEITEEIRSSAYDRKQIDQGYNKDVGIDYNTVQLTVDVFPPAIRDLGEHIEDARELHREIVEDEYFGEGNNIEYQLSQDQRPEKERKWLENYREAENIYFEIFSTLDDDIEGETITEYIEHRYGIDLSYGLDDIPAPKLDNR